MRYGNRVWIPATGCPRETDFYRYTVFRIFRLGVFVLWVCRLPGRFANGVFFCSYIGRGVLALEYWAVVRADFWAFLAISLENMPSIPKNFQKNRKIYKISLCKREKMGYNKFQKV